jgi:mannose/fructose/N-acetylgalactosamine-specific phosphotransferase system component IIC
MNIDRKQQVLINLALVGVGIVGAIISAMIYRDNKKHDKIKEEVAVLDKEIKVLELAIKKHEAAKNGLI